MSLKGQDLFSLKDLSGLQRELVGMLAASPGYSASHDQIQLAFWPDSAPDKARSSLDTLKYRFMKALKDYLPIDADPYLDVGKGFLRLANVKIDAIDFISEGRRGLKLYRQRLLWQADCAFHTSFSYWREFTLTELFMNDQAITLYDDIIETMREISLTWARLLVELNRPKEAIQIMEKSSKLLPYDDECVIMRYHLYLRTNNYLKAKEIVKSYRQALIDLDYPEDEAEEMINDLINSPDPFGQEG